VSIKAVIKGLRIRAFAAHLAQEKPSTIENYTMSLRSIAGQITTFAEG
jgi:hypothetical protein